MKSFLAGVFVTAPITGLVMFLWLGNRHTVELRQERAVVQQRLDDERFDAEFDRLTRDMRKPENRRRAEARERRIEKLQGQLSDLDRQARADLMQSSKDAAAAREALLAAPAPGDPGDPGRP